MRFEDGAALVEANTPAVRWTLRPPEVAIAAIADESVVVLLPDGTLRGYAR